MSKLLILRSEPVRAVLYPLVLGLAAWLVAKGVIDDTTALWVTGGVAAALGLPATEFIRNSVSPVGKVVDVASEVISDVEREYSDDGKLDRGEVETIGRNAVNSVLTRLRINARV